MTLKRWGIVAVGASALLFAGALAHFCKARIVENWPPHVISPKFRSLGLAEAKRYRDGGYDASLRSQKYVAGNNYLNYGQTFNFRESAVLRFDAEGIPMQKAQNEDKFFYTPGMLAQYALTMHGKNELPQFVKAAKKLQGVQGKNGALTYGYAWRHYSEPRDYAPGWFSGMDQGLALSVYARAYVVTKEKIFLEKGNKALEFLLQPFPHGPRSDLRDLDPSLAHYVYFEEYIADPHVYTLNGYIFTLLGLYDWWKIANSTIAGDYFQRGVATLEKLLPYFDVGTFSAYDLSYITSQKPYLQPLPPRLAARYHALHIAQLRALESVTGSAVFRQFAEKWNGYVTTATP